MINLDHTAFRAAVADTHAAADRLRDDRDRVAREVDGLLDGGWSGAAATAYADGWDDWKRAADSILRGLTTMGELLDAAHADLTLSDVASGSSLARLSARLG